jgi:hypothetical protein
VKTESITVSEPFTVRSVVGGKASPRTLGLPTAAGAVQRAYAKHPEILDLRVRWPRKRFFHYLHIEHEIDGNTVTDVVKIPGWSSASIGTVLTWVFWLSRHLTALTHAILPWRATYSVHSVGFEADLDREAYEEELSDPQGHSDQGL